MILQMQFAILNKYFSLSHYYGLVSLWLSEGGNRWALKCLQIQFIILTNTICDLYKYSFPLFNVHWSVYDYRREAIVGDLWQAIGSTDRSHPGMLRIPTQQLTNIKYKYKKIQNYKYTNIEQISPKIQKLIILNTNIQTYKNTTISHPGMLLHSKYSQNRRYKYKYKITNAKPPKILNWPVQTSGRNIFFRIAGCICHNSKLYL